MAIEYQQAAPKKIEEQVRRKYQASINELKQLNFEELCFYSEGVPTLGMSYGLAGLLGTFLALPNEVAKIGITLSVRLFHLVLVSKESTTYAIPFGLGVKFFTGFTDGTCVISATFESREIHDDNEKLYKSARPRSIAVAWTDHQNLVDKFCSEGKQRKHEAWFRRLSRVGETRGQLYAETQSRNQRGHLAKGRCHRGPPNQSPKPTPYRAASQSIQACRVVSWRCASASIGGGLALPLGGPSNNGEWSMEAKVEFRLAINQDVDGIINVARITWHDTYAGIILPEIQEHLLERWYSTSVIEAALTQSESWFYVAMAKEQVIGYAQFIVRKNRRGELTRIYVLPEYQYQGIGKRMLKDGLSSLKNYGMEKVFVQVEKENAKGINFYERNGFHPTRELSIELPGQSLNLIEYAFSLGAK